MNNSVRMYEYTFDEKEYSNMIETVIDGTIKINENEGNAILDYQNKKIKLTSFILLIKTIFLIEFFYTSSLRCS